MCGTNEFFSTLDTLIRGDVSFGDLSKTPVCGKFNVAVTFHNGEKKFIEDIYYVPTLKCNVISFGQLLEKGYTIEMKDRSLIMRNK